jgi:hypothetical protein
MNTTGTESVAIGENSLIQNNGNSCVGIGRAACYSAVTLSNATAVGHSALYDLASGAQNTAIGFNTGRGITGGANNTIIGAQVTGLDALTADNIILATGDGAIRQRFDEGVWSMYQGVGTTGTLVTNGQIMIEIVSNTQLRFKVRGSDGVTRSNTLTLA